MGLFSDDEEMTKKIAEGKARNAKLLGKWVTVLFWLQIAAIVGEVLASDTVREILPSVYWMGTLLGYGIMIANSVILIRLKAVEDWFGKAGVCYLVSGLSGIVAAVLLLGSAETIGSLLAIAMLIVQLRGNYDECTGYEVVLRGTDNGLAEKWALQWKLEIAFVLGTIIVPVMLGVGLIFGGRVLTVIAGIVTFLAAVGVLVLGILRLVYMYRTAEIFRSYQPEDVKAEEGEI